MASLDMWCLGEGGPSPLLSGLFCFSMVALGAAASIPNRSWWRLARVLLGLVVFVALTAAWFFASIFLGYVD